MDIKTNDPAEFLCYYAPYKDINELRERIQKHRNYKTCRILIDGAGMVFAVCLWNIIDNGQAAFVTEMTIRKDYKKKDIMRRILAEVMNIWPLKFLVFDREKKDGTHKGKRRIWSTERFLRRKA